MFLDNLVARSHSFRTIKYLHHETGQILLEVLEGFWKLALHGPVHKREGLHGGMAGSGSLSSLPVICEPAV